MRELQDLAGRLLAEKSVGVVIGYEEGRLGVRPAIITEAAEAGRLLFDPRCVHNLAAYLSPRRPLIAALGRAAIVVKACDARAVAGLIRESQRRREDLVLIGVRCGGVLRDPTSRAPLSAGSVAPRCGLCAGRAPSRVDHLLGPELPAPPQAADREARLAELEALGPVERFRTWSEILERCLRCHACRQVCPMCFCERCVADKSQPQWLETSPHARGNVAWHVTRALHLAGRCVDCGECERACPVAIPLGLLSRKVARVVEDRYGHRPTDDPGQPSPIGAFRPDDGQEFIL